jgi:hypothetical protein
VIGDALARTPAFVPRKHSHAADRAMGSGPFRLWDAEHAMRVVPEHHDRFGGRPPVPIPRLCLRTGRAADKPVAAKDGRAGRCWCGYAGSRCSCSALPLAWVITADDVPRAAKRRLR